MAVSQVENGAPPSPLVGEGAHPKSGLPDLGHGSVELGQARVRWADEGAKRSPVGQAHSLRKRQTESEKALWRILRDRRFSGWKFRRQCPMGRYILDFVCLESKLIIEADGSEHLGKPGDRRRDAWFANQGFSILRFWNSDILARRSEVAETIWAALAATPHPSASPTPSPTRGEGNGVLPQSNAGNV